jgi:VIT1/CCC1 family predicted Fe2+/Mn2+ transporter
MDPGVGAKWIRAVFLCADAAIISTANLMLVFAASSASRPTIVWAGVSGLVAGALSTGANQYILVSSEHDGEVADLVAERDELLHEPPVEPGVLASIYVKMGLDPDLAAKVAAQLAAPDPVSPPLKDELDPDARAFARPIGAACISALCFASFALVPVIGLLLTPPGAHILTFVSLPLCCLAALGALRGRLGGGPMARAALRATLGGALAMAAAAAIGGLFRGVLT